MTSSCVCSLQAAFPSSLLWLGSSAHLSADNSHLNKPSSAKIYLPLIRQSRALLRFWLLLLLVKLLAQQFMSG